MTLVTDEMVEAALTAWGRPTEPRSSSDARTDMRAALKAVEEDLVGAWWEKLGEEIGEAKAES